MKLIRGLHNLTSSLKNSVVTLGNFDGLHLGHQKLINTVKLKSKSLGVPSVVITFEPQPKEFFAKKQEIARLMRFSEKYLSVKQLGVDYFCVLYFNETLAKLSATQFVEEILVAKLGMQAVVIGHDFCFGAKRQGNESLLRKLAQQHQFEVIALDPVMVQAENVSSTRVRQALQQGNLSLVHDLLGRHYALRGKVSYGDARGRELGFPTANINLHREYVPLSGVFVVQTMIFGKKYKGVANVGVRPTFYGQRVLLEVHLFDFNQSIYGLNLEVVFLHKLRDEKRYDHFDDLVKQIHQDVSNAKQYFANHVIEA